VESRRLSIAADDLRQRVTFRLAAGRPNVSKIVWTDGGDELLIHLDSLKCAFADGWLVCELELEAGGPGRQKLQCVYFLGRTGDTDGTRAAATLKPIGAASEAIADRWGRNLQRVIWDAVLDAIEGAAAHAGAQAKVAMVLLGFSCTRERLNVDLAPKGS
jgi:hypothetical protein